MMHPILTAVYRYLNGTQEGDVVPPSPEALAKLTHEALVLFQKQFAKQNSRENFTIRMSNLGRPLCQLQLEQSGVVVEKEVSPYAPMRNAYGNIIETMAMFVLKESGIRILEEQKLVKLPVANTVIEGTFDVKLDYGNGPAIWDIKSVSSWQFRNKMSSFKALYESGDAFGYICQGYGYAIADGTPFGGFIVVNKETGEWNVLERPPVDDDIKKWAWETIETNVKALTTNAPFERKFAEIDELFRKKPTGNKYLPATCGFCQFRKHCWPTAEYLANPSSKSQNPTYRWYTHVNSNQPQEHQGVVAGPDNDSYPADAQEQ